MRDRSLTVGAAVLVLAAGRSRRFGADDKRLASWRGLPLLAHVLDRVTSLSLPVTVVVAEDDAAPIDRVLEAHAGDATVVRNPDPDAGLSGSLALGVAALRDHDAILVCLADMPHVRSATMRQLLEASDAAPDRTMVFPRHAGRRGNPVLVRSALFDEVIALDGDGGARRLARRHAERVLDVPVDDPGVLLDVDRPGDLVSSDR